MESTTKAQYRLKKMKEVLKLVGNLLEGTDDDIVTLEVTVPTGFEHAAKQEIIKKFDIQPTKVYNLTGRIYFNIPKNAYEQVKELYSIDNIYLLVSINDVQFCNEKEKDLETVVSILNEIDLPSAVNKWADLSNFNGIVYIMRGSPVEFMDNWRRTKHMKCGELTGKLETIKYRATCERHGDHAFGSTDVQYKFGGEINDRYEWTVDLTKYDVEIIIRVYQDYGMVLCKLTNQSLHHRNLIHRGPTALRPTIAYGMVALVEPQPGEIIVDPLCGSGSIVLECLNAFPQSAMLCGDILKENVEMTKANIEALGKENCVTDVFLWNATLLPFMEKTVHAIVTDLPFGRRCGSIQENKKLYDQCFKEFLRVLHPTSGRLLAISRDVHNLFRALDSRNPKSAWVIKHQTNVNVGNLKCTLILARPRNAL